MAAHAYVHAEHTRVVTTSIDKMSVDVTRIRMMLYFSFFNLGNDGDDFYGSSGFGQLKLSGESLATWRFAAQIETGGSCPAGNGSPALYDEDGKRIGVFWWS